MGWTGCQNNPIYLNFHLQKSLEIFEKNSADKIWSNKDIKVKVPCPVLDKVKFLGLTLIFKTFVISNIVTSCIVSLHTGIGANFASPMWILSRDC